MATTNRLVFLLIGFLLPISVLGSPISVVKSAGGLGSIAQKQLARYSSFATSRPVASNVVQGAVLFVGGDILAQLAQPEPDPSRRTVAARCRRSLTSGAFGATYIGLFAAQWYRLMDHAMPGHAKGALIGKVAGNCLMLGIIGNAANMYVRRYSRVGCRNEALAFTKKSLCPVVMHDFKVWPAFDFFCFGNGVVDCLQEKYIMRRRRGEWVTSKIQERSAVKVKIRDEQGEVIAYRCHGSLYRKSIDNPVFKVGDVDIFRFFLRNPETGKLAGYWEFTESELAISGRMKRGHIPLKVPQEHQNKIHPPIRNTRNKKGLHWVASRFVWLGD